MSYNTYRQKLIASYYDYQLESLVTAFHPDKKSVILLPGGMGSQLERTESPYPNSPNVITRIIWVDSGIVGELDALKLEIDPQGKDKDSYVIAPHGPLSFGLLGLKPYEKLRDFAQTQGWNYGVFGFDWRRPLEESSKFFKDFILSFRRRIIHDYGKDPIPNLTIVCHSMGGLVCTDALRDGQFSNIGLHAVITIAAPFYGTSTQQERYFVGIPEFLNTIYSAKEVVRIVASLPGPYVLMFMPKSIYNRDGGRLNLARYPQYDPNRNIDTDPYDPAVMKRWPKVVRDHRQYLLDAKKSMENISTPIAANIAPRFFNVRSCLDKTTAVELRWNNVDGDDIVPGITPSPLTGVAGPGDGTVPGWSAWHAYCRGANRHELKQAKDHAFLLEHPEVLAVIDSIVKIRKLPTAMKRRAVRPAVASEEAMARAVTKWVKRRKRKQPLPPELLAKPVQRAMLASLIAGKKPRMTVRLQQSISRRRK